MLIKTAGIPLKTTRYSESSLIVKIYTREKGMLSFLIQGALSSRSAIKPSMLMPLQPIEMVIYYQEKKNLNKIREVHPAYILKGLYADIHKTAIATVITEIILKTIKEHEANENLFDFIKEAIAILDECSEDVHHFLIVFMIKMSRHLGFYPYPGFSEDQPWFNMQEGKFGILHENKELLIAPPLSEYFNKALYTDLHTFHSLSFTAEIRVAILRKLIDYYRIHVPGFSRLNSVNVIIDVFS